MIDLAGARWRKSRRSGSQSNCVELAVSGRAVRDSKNPEGGVLVFDQRAAAGFLSAVKAGRFDG